MGRPLVRPWHVRSLIRWLIVTRIEPGAGVRRHKAPPEAQWMMPLVLIRNKRQDAADDTEWNLVHAQNHEVVMCRAVVHQAGEVKPYPKGED